MATKILDIRGGHRYYRDNRGRLLVADDSGTGPYDCDDGPLEVDQDAARAGLPVGESGRVGVPLVGDRWTVASMAEGAALAHVLGVQLVVAGFALTVRKVVK
jgi:hypothetical protein